MKKILLITAMYTGHGHKSISDALVEQFREFPGLEVRVIDGFELLGAYGPRMSKLYGVTTRYASGLWKLSYELSDGDNLFFKTGITGLSSFSLGRFRRLMEEEQPDLIVSVHSLFNGSILRLLRQLGLETPLAVVQADIVNIHKSWCEPGACRTICPTQEAYECSLRHGMPPEKLVKIGFPTRRQFTDWARSHPRPEYDGKRPLRCLMMSGGEGSGNLKRYAESLMTQTDVSLTIICGRNRRMKEALEEAFLPAYQDRMRILGFVTEMQKEMADKDLLIARGSPNSLMEGVVMNLPLIVTGALPGQEQDNPQLIANHNLGVVCEGPEKIPQQIDILLQDHCRQYREIAAAQREYRDLDNAKKIAEYLVGLMETKTNS